MSRFSVVVAVLMGAGSAAVAQTPNDPPVAEALKIADQVANGVRPERLPWEQVATTPDGYVPQGLAVRSGRIYLSAHQNDQSSALFELDADAGLFRRLFDFPDEASHTSGIDFHPQSPELLFAVDYNSDQVYAIDFAASMKNRTAAVVARTDSGLRGTSACCFADTPEHGVCLMVTDFRNSQKNVFFRFNKQQRTLTQVDGLAYRNRGFSQGAKSHRGLVFETGNSFLTSYVVAHKLSTALDSGQVVPLRIWLGPDRLIEDLVILKNHIYLATEGRNAIYRAPLDATLFHSAGGQRSLGPVTATMKNVDHAGILLLSHEPGGRFQQVGFCEITHAGLQEQAGETAVELRDSLKTGANFLVFAVFDAGFRGGGVLQTKCSADLDLTSQGKLLWKKSLPKRGHASREIRYWKVVRLDLDRGGAVQMSDDIPKEFLQRSRKLLSEMEDAFVKTGPVAQLRRRLIDVIANHSQEKRED